MDIVNALLNTYKDDRRESCEKYIRILKLRKISGTGMILLEGRSGLLFRRANCDATRSIPKS